MKKGKRNDMVTILIYYINVSVEPTANKREGVEE